MGRGFEEEFLKRVLRGGFEESLGESLVVPCGCMLPGCGVCVVGVSLVCVLDAVDDASVSRGVGRLTCGPRCPPSPRAVVPCQVGCHVAGTFTRANKSPQCWCSHAPSHSVGQSGCEFVQSRCRQRPVVIHLSHMSGLPAARRMAVNAGRTTDFAYT